MDEGQVYRIDFLKFLQSKDDTDWEVDIYGKDNSQNFKNYKGSLLMSEKSKGLIPYKYYFMVENNCERII